MTEAERKYKGKPIELIEVHSELGAGTMGAALGPPAVRAAYRQSHGPQLDALPRRVVRSEYPPPSTAATDFSHARALPQILGIYQRLADELLPVFAGRRFPLILSGDHSSAGGLLGALRLARPTAKLGVIWIDAHADLNTPHTTPSGNLHGMPLAVALGQATPETGANTLSEAESRGWDALCELGGLRPKFAPEDLFLIGIRSTEAPEDALINRLGIACKRMPALNEEGTEAILQQAVEHFAGYEGVYVSFDIDSLDAPLVPGTGTPVPGGLDEPMAAVLLTELWKRLPLAALELTEVNPLLDTANQTGQLGARLLAGLPAVPS